MSNIKDCFCRERIIAIRLLLDTIEDEIKYGEKREKEVEKAKIKLLEEKQNGKNPILGYFEYLPKKYLKPYNKSKIKRCAINIREFCLDFYKDKEDINNETL